VFKQPCAIVSKRLGSPYRSGRHALSVKTNDTDILRRKTRAVSSLSVLKREPLLSVLLFYRISCSPVNA
jgi:hypothetical protein